MAGPQGAKPPGARTPSGQQGTPPHSRAALGLSSLVPCPQEYADNLTNSGVHGAVLVLEPTFNAEAMATALGIPSGKHILRRHLAEEMSAVFPPAT